MLVGLVRRQYIWMEGRPIAVVEGGQIYFIHTDHIGRPVFATNDLGVKVWEASYLPFGGVHVATGGIDLRFPGQWLQAESGLHQNWMRDYDPTTGRYIEADPLGLVDGASVYGYARQNPGRWTDPRGEDTRSGQMSFPAPMWPGETYPGELGQSMLDLNRKYNPILLVIEKAIEKCASCPPCRTVSGKVVPVGTIGYRPLDTPKRAQHGITGPHHNIFEAKQNPINCQCFWKNIGAVSPANLPAGAIPIEPFAQ